MLGSDCEDVENRDENKPSKSKKCKMEVNKNKKLIVMNFYIYL